MGLTVLLVFLRLEIALDGDTVAFLQEVEGSSVLVLAPHLDVEECALALVLTVNLLGTCDAEAEELNFYDAPEAGKEKVNIRSRNYQQILWNTVFSLATTWRIEENAEGCRQICTGITAWNR